MADRNAQIVISLRNQADPEVRKLAASFRALAGETTTAARNFDVLERQFQQLQNSEIRAATATGDYARALRLVRSELDAAGQGTVRYNQLLVQQAQIQTRAAAAQRREMDALRGAMQPAAAQAQGLAGTFGSLGSVAGAAGIAFGAREVVRFGLDAGAAALSLRETENSLRAVAGSTEVYNQILAEARRQQLLFGGSLQDNIEGLSGLAVISRSTGANLTDLIDLQKRLTLLDPAQGAQGARIALSEALSGNISSLSRRFEIPKDKIRELTDASIPAAERLKSLSTFLDSVGITSEAVAGRVDKSAVAYRGLAAAADTAKTTVGGFLADALVPTAQTGTNLLGVFQGTRQGWLDAAIGAQSFAQQLIGLGPVTAKNEEINRRFGASLLGIAPAAQTAAATILQAADAGDRAAAALAELDAQNRRVGGAFDEVRSQIAQFQVATGLAESDIRRSAEASQLDAAQKDLQQQKTAVLAAQTQAAVRAFLALNPNLSSSGAAAAAAAQGYSPLIARLAAIQIEADNARGALALLAAQQAGVAAAQAKLTAGLVDPKGAIGGAAAPFAAGLKSQADQAFAANNRVYQSEIQLRLARATTAQQRIAILNEELARTTDLADRNSILAQIERERNSGAKSQTSELNKQLSLEERIRDSKESQLRATLDASAAIIRDRQQRREEDAALKLADRRLSNPRLTADQRQAVQDQADLIRIEQQQRLLQIREQLATAGGQVINGRILQSRPGGTLPALPQVGALPGLPVLPQPGGVGGGGVPQIEVLVTLDGQQIAASVVTRLRGGLAQATSAGAGR